MSSDVPVFKVAVFASDLGWNGQAVWKYETVLYIALAYIVLCKLNYGCHNQTRFQ